MATWPPSDGISGWFNEAIYDHSATGGWQLIRTGALGMNVNKCHNILTLHFPGPGLLSSSPPYWLIRNKAHNVNTITFFPTWIFSLLGCWGVTRAVRCRCDDTLTMLVTLTMPGPRCPHCCHHHTPLILIIITHPNACCNTDQNISKWP